MKRQIINIINFVRACEPRIETDLITPVKEQIRLMQKHSLEGTFLLQYDALVNDEFLEIFQNIDQTQFELGVWYEVVQPLVEDSGLVWKGRFPWDWHTDCGFPVGYTKSERKMLIDTLYEKFKRIFGYYPRVFGSWFFDSYTARYVSDTYGADAYCNCKEQFGTDGYTLWGGYYGQGYYPSRNNVFLPAINQDNQLPVPLFRMLGSDQVYQYDFELDVQREVPEGQQVVTLEPVYCGTAGGGGVPQWVDWYMKENFNGECLSFGYAQAGQENSFGWPAMKDGLTYQFALFEKLRAEGKIEVEQLGETGRWYKETYSETPASTITAHTAFDSQKDSVWYSTKQYRINLYTEDGAMRIRDLHIYSDQVTDPYEDTVCTESCAYYEALPVVDGNRYSGKGVRAGAYLTYADGSQPAFGPMEFHEIAENTASVTYGSITVELRENSVKILADKPFTLENRIGISGNHLPQVQSLTKQQIDLAYDGVDYAVVVKQGTVMNPTMVRSEGNVMEFEFRS